jgi:hypothetical protein
MLVTRIVTAHGRVTLRGQAPATLRCRIEETKVLFRW